MKKILLALLFVSLVFASGFNISEQGTRATAMGSAFIARAFDPSAVFYNPAGIAFLGKKWTYLGGTLIAPRGSFEGANPFPGEGVEEKLSAQYFPVPNFYFVYPASEKLTFGFGVYSPFGLGTKWENAKKFTGRYISTNSYIKMVTLNPVIAYKFSDAVSLGVGLQYSFSKVHMEQYLPAYNPFSFKIEDVGTALMDSNWKGTLGFNAGILVKPSEKFSFGLTYRHHQKANYKGTANLTQIPTGNSVFDGIVSTLLPFNKDLNVKASIKYPSYIGGGVAFYPTEKLSFEFDLGYTFWSMYKELPVSFTDYPQLNPSSEEIKEYYKNNFTGRFGVEYKVKEGTYLRAGYVYDQKAAEPESVTPILPDTTRHLISLGLGKDINENLYVDITGIYLLGEDRSTEGKNKYGYEGTFKTNALLLGIDFGYRF